MALFVPQREACTWSWTWLWLTRNLASWGPSVGEARSSCQCVLVPIFWPLCESNTRSSSSEAEASVNRRDGILEVIKPGRTSSTRRIAPHPLTLTFRGLTHVGACCGNRRNFGPSSGHGPAGIVEKNLMRPVVLLPYAKVAPAQTRLVHASKAIMAP